MADRDVSSPGVALGEPVVVAQAPAGVRNWGPWQFPSIQRLPDGRLAVACHVEADSATAYGLPRQIPYRPDLAADAHAGERDGFTEPNVAFLPGGSAMCLPRTTADPDGQVWDDRITVVEPAAERRATCSYSDLLPLTPHEGLLVYSHFDWPGPDGEPRKTVLTRRLAVRGAA